MKDCPECNLSFDEIQYYEHYLVDHDVVFCIFCSSKLRPKNFQQHIFTIHSIDWKSIEFVQQFINYYGNSTEVLSVLHELEYFIPLSIIKNIKELFLDTPNRSEENKLLLKLELIQTRFRLGEILPNIVTIINEFYKEIFDAGPLFLRAKFILFALEIETKTSFNTLMVREFKKILEQLNNLHILDVRLEVLAKAISLSLQEKNNIMAKKYFETATALISEEHFIGKDKRLFELKILECFINEDTNELYKLILEYIARNQDYPIRIAQLQLSKTIIHLNRKEHKKAVNDILSAMELYKKYEYNIKFIDASQILTKVYILDKNYTNAYDNIRNIRFFFEQLVGPGNIGIVKYQLPILHDLLSCLQSDENYFHEYKKIHELRITIADIIEDIDQDLDIFARDLQDQNELLQTLVEFKESFSEYYYRLKQLENQTDAQ